MAAIRAEGLDTDVFILGAVDPCDFVEAVKLNGQVSVWRVDQLKELEKAAKAVEQIGKYQIKIDTGMGRLGLFPEEADRFFHQTREYRYIQCTGIYSHFCGADLDDLTCATEQLTLFEATLKRANAHGLCPKFVHIANSPATIRLPKAHLNLVRLGIAAYGLVPSASSPLPTAVEAIGSWTTKLLNVKTLPAGHGVSYGAEYRTSHSLRAGVIPVGYADGFRRYPPQANTVVIRGCEIAVLGRVCMDHAVVDLSGCPDAQLGDEVTILGVHGKKVISAETLAHRWGTNNYDVVANIGNRVRRKYTDAAV